VHFFDGSTELNVTVTDAIAAQATLDVSYTWTVTDAITLGNHTLGIGVDSQAVPDYWAEENITVVGVANVSITSLTVSAASEFEGVNVTFTAKLFNNGTLDSDLLMVEFFDGTTMIGNKTNVTVAKGLTVDVTFQWLLPQVELDTNKTIKAKVAGMESPVNLTIKNKVPKIEVLTFTVGDGRIGDNATFAATVKNNGTGDAVNITVDFYDGATKVGSSAAFNLSVGSTKDVTATIKLAGTPDANHTFYAKIVSVGATEKNATKMVSHTLTAASLYIVSMTVKPTKLEGKAKDSTQTYKITIVVKNSGETRGQVNLSMMEGKKLITSTPVVIQLDGLATFNQTYEWKVKGDGEHKCVATLSAGAVGTPSTKEVKVKLAYTPGFEVLVLVGAMIAALVLVRRRKN
jgi:hypothetical protein